MEHHTCLPETREQPKKLVCAALDCITCSDLKTLVAAVAVVAAIMIGVVIIASYDT